jgi:uncharacterized protein (TIGR03435 family)
VVAHTGSAHNYAGSLLRLVEWKLAPVNSILAAGIFTRRSRLRARIETLLRKGREFSPAAARMPVGVASVALAGLAAAGALAPHWIAFAQRPEFEVVSVKVNHSNEEPEIPPRRSGTLVTMHNVQVGSIIYYAYHLEGFYQLTGTIPEWPFELKWFDIDARTTPDATEDQVRLMFQSMLADRFKLQAHRETRDISEYLLTLGKGKLQLTPSDSKEPMKIRIEDRPHARQPGTCGTAATREGSQLVCHAVPMERIAAQISLVLHSPAADRTGLTGTYDMNLRFMSEGRTPEPDQIAAPTLAEALAEVGLKLEKGKGAVEVLVIDHIERPSDN